MNVLVYTDTSAFLKLLVEEAESKELRSFFDADGLEFVSSMLLYTEAHCVASRQRSITRQSVSAALKAISLIELEVSDLERAGESYWGLRSADAIHLATALRVGAGAMLTYDNELGEAASGMGMDWLKPK